MTDKLLDHLKRALGESYTIERELSGGGMSRVFVAREHSLGREVVIKVLPKELAAGVNRERFQQEVQLAARLSHPYIVPLLHAGEHEDLLWFTMPFITGESLRYRLEHEGPLPVRDMLQLAHDVVEALAYAHSRGVIHRDIKPANILVDGGHAVVTDFGVAKALSAAMPTMGAGHTTTGMAIGTPAYMAPEQLAADPAADHRVDIYAVGLLMYELLAGASPFSTPSPTATMTAQLTQMPGPLNQVRKDVPAGLSALIMHCLAKAPDERPASADDVLKGLDQISGEIAAVTHGASRSFVVRRLIPITAALALVTVAAAASMIWSNRNAASNAAPATPTLPVAPSSDQPQTAALPKVPTHDDSVKICLRLTEDPAICGVTGTTALRNGAAKVENRSATVPEVALPNLDSVVNAAVDARLKTMGITNFRPGFDPGRIPAVTTIGPGGPPAVNEALRNAPRKVVVQVLPGSRRGAADTATRAITEHLIADFGRQIERNWQIVRPDFSRSPGQNDTTLANANAVIFVSLAPGRTPQDSMELYLTMRNPAGGQHFIRKAIAPGASQADLQSAIDLAQSWLRELRNNPNAPWGDGGRNGGGPGPRPGGGGGGGGPRIPGQGRGGPGQFQGDSIARGGGPTG